jgi:hypothetical protein
MATQGNSVLPMGLCLENYSYAFPVSYVTLNIQRQVLKMAFMDVQPEHPNGRTVMLLHGKNFCGAYWGQTVKALTGKGYRGNQGGVGQCGCGQGHRAWAFDGRDGGHAFCIAVPGAGGEIYP